MRARFKGPSGTGVVEFRDDVTLNLLFEELRARTGIQNFRIKYGPPMAMNTITTECGDLEARSLGLNGETLTIVPDDQELSTTSIPPTASKTGDSQHPEDVTVSWPQREGTLRNICRHIHD